MKNINSFKLVFCVTYFSNPKKLIIATATAGIKNSLLVINFKEFKSFFHRDRFFVKV